MNKVSFRFLLLALLAGPMASTPALAQRHGHGHGHGHGHSHVRFGIGINFGVPLFGYPYYYPPFYHYPAVYSPVVLSQPAPPVYVEQSVSHGQSYQQASPRPASQAAPQPAQNWWYFCAESNGYYPYVKQCAAGWQRVSPHPPG